MRYVSLTAHSLDKLRNDYIKEHSKFIHSSYLLLEDLDKVVEIKGKNFRIAGLWDIIGYRKIILMQAENGSHCYLDSKEIAAALGFTTFRNFVTGKPITYDIAAQKSYDQMMNKIKIENEAAPTAEIDDDRIVEDEVIEESIDEIDAPIMDRDNEYVPENEEDIESEEDEFQKSYGSDDDEDFTDEY